MVDDDRSLRDALRRALTLAEYEVQTAENGQQALSAAATDAPDAMVLDLGLPDMDGTAVCRALRRASDVPIIAVTARAEERDRVLGLRTGADDYVVKPYSTAELLARIEAVMRRSNPTARVRSSSDESAPAPAAVPLRSGSLVVDLDGRRVSLQGEPIRLSRKEFDVLAVLARACGAVCSREAILDEVWGATLFGSTRTLDVHVATLRSKLGDPELVETVRGVGYRLRAAPAEP